MPAPRPLPTQQELHDLYDYSVVTGLLYHKSNGQPVTPAPDNRGYRRARVGGEHRRNFLQHRLIWRWVTGEDPGELTVNHVDNDPTNNAWHNTTVVYALLLRTVNDKHAIRSVDRSLSTVCSLRRDVLGVLSRWQRHSASGARTLLCWHVTLLPSVLIVSANVTPDKLAQLTGHSLQSVPYYYCTQHKEQLGTVQPEHCQRTARC